MLKLIILSLISIFCYMLYIRIFKFFKQYERSDGLRSHQIKNGTITMGGILFIILPLFFIQYDYKLLFIIIPSCLYGILGLVDDLLIIIKKNNKGINPNLKLVFQVIIAAIAFILMLKNNIPTIIDLYIFKINIKWVYGMFILFLGAASTNSFNLTDGVDGLLSGLSLILGAMYMLISYEKNEMGVFYLIASVNICLFVFFCLNYPKAFLFMGDTGSLFLGSFYMLIAIYLNTLVCYIITSVIFIFEALSVIIQVFYYKKTHKRIFKMAPFHHHLESSGYSEIEVDLIFFLIEIILVLVVLLFKIY